MKITVGELVHRVFPFGTDYMEPFPSKGPSFWPLPPSYPPDMFAVCGYILEKSGAYQSLTPGGESSFDGGRRGLIFFSENINKELSSVAEEWRSNDSFGQVPKKVTELWEALGKCLDSEIYDTDDLDEPESGPRGSRFEKWGEHALKLLVIADEACAGFGYKTLNEGTEAEASWIFYQYNVMLGQRLRAPKPAVDGHVKGAAALPSITICAHPGVVCVQPKSRTPSVGSSFRNLSHNLALLPPASFMRTAWHMGNLGSAKNEDDGPLNILLIPYPYTLKPSWFASKQIVFPSSVQGDEKPWGWFTLKQGWLGEGQSDDVIKQKREDIINFTLGLIAQAASQCGEIHAVVFPEFSLDWLTYDELTKKVVSQFKSIEFFISGSRNNCYEQAGNVVLSTIVSKEATDARFSVSRKKHHRWRVEEEQIRTYALASQLDPRSLWWESIALKRREIYVHPFRTSSTFTAMICEDLARSDPAHPVLRSIGPNLVFVLLMDGPQLAVRWPARYATVLSEDPGSSVLTLTSLGLIERANRQRKEKTRSISLWSDDTGRVIPLECPEGHHGVVVNIAGVRATEYTLDNRVNKDTRAWRYFGHQPVKFVPNSVAQEATLRNIVES